jgi:hypothetical protein
MLIKHCSLRLLFHGGWRIACTDSNHEVFDVTEVDCTESLGVPISQPNPQT